MNDANKRYLYPKQVQVTIQQDDIGEYQRAAARLRESRVELISLQHEYGIFGGTAGEHLLTLLGGCGIPVVTTLHTILAKPEPAQNRVMRAICVRSERLVVMSENGAKLLHGVYGVPSSKIQVIHHGVPDLPDFVQSKEQLGLDGRKVLLTFGLLSPDKGIEYAIDALAEIVKEYPDVVYVVLGATHPQVREQYGEEYRHMLQDRGRRLNLDGHLVFHDRFADHSELIRFLAAADVYLTPYLNPEQITSGTLAYAVGSGKAVVSTPYSYAKELLAEGRGVLVPVRNAAELARGVLGLLDGGERRGDIETRAATLGASMRWPAVASAYVECFARAVLDANDSRTRFASSPSVRATDLPPLNLAHLRTMTDETGILQHASFSVPRYEDGYCLDDNARALLLITLIEEGRSSADVSGLATRYLAFVRYAFDGVFGRFTNFMAYSRRWTELRGSEDSHGRALWALGTVIGRSPDLGHRALARMLFDAALPAVAEFTSPRAWAYTLLGVGEYVRSHKRDCGTISMGRMIAVRLLGLFAAASRMGWLWCEDRLTYCNARLPQAMISSGVWLENEEMISTGVRALEWLARVQTTEAGLFSPIGSNGFYVRGCPKAIFDQQPVEASAMIAACLEAYRVDHDHAWLERAHQAFQWFMGDNLLGERLYDSTTGGCRDGLHQDRPNENQGAESTLAFLLALLDMQQVAGTAITSRRRSFERVSTSAVEVRQ